MHTSESTTEQLVLRDPPLDPVALAQHVSAWKVSLDGRRCTEDDLRQLAHLPRLTHLRLSGLHAGLAALADLPHLEDLHLGDPATLAGLELVQGLQVLTLYYFPRIHSLEALGALTRLRALYIATPPSYDASRKCHHVDSLEPLGGLTGLESLTMRGVLPDDRTFAGLHRLAGLRRLEITHVYGFPLKDYARLARALPDTDGNCLHPYYAAAWAGTCRKCGGPRVVLTAPPPRTPRIVCPRCGRPRLERHVAAWDAVTRA